MSPRLSGTLLMLLVSVLWSFGGVLIKSVEWHPMAIAGARSAIAAVVIAAFTGLPRPPFSRMQIAGGLAYVGLDHGRIAVVDLASGSVLEVFKAGTEGTESVSDLIVIDNTLYALLRPKLLALPLNEDQLRVAAEVDSPGTSPLLDRRMRLSGGNGLLYAASGIGFNVFSITNPLTPVRIARHETAQFGWKQIVPNGSGLGVAAVGLNSSETGVQDIYLHDLRPGGTNSSRRVVIMA